MKKEQLNNIIKSYDIESGKLLGILENIQKKERYLPKSALVYLSERLGIPLSKIYSVVTFYSFFNLSPLGKNVITVCMGTACHVRGAPRILKAFEKILEIKEGESTPDGKFMLTTKDKLFTLNTARCFGACSMAPVVRVNDEIFGYVTPERLPSILKKYGWREK